MQFISFLFCIHWKSQLIFLVILNYHYQHFSSPAPTDSSVSDWKLVLLFSPNHFNCDIVDYSFNLTRIIASLLHFKSACKPAKAYSCFFFTGVVLYSLWEAGVPTPVNLMSIKLPLYLCWWNHKLSDNTIELPRTTSLQKYNRTSIYRDLKKKYLISKNVVINYLRLLHFEPEDSADFFFRAHLTFVLSRISRSNVGDLRKRL